MYWILMEVLWGKTQEFWRSDCKIPVDSLIKDHWLLWVCVLYYYVLYRLSWNQNILYFEFVDILVTISLKFDCKVSLSVLECLLIHENISQHFWDVKCYLFIKIYIFVAITFKTSFIWTYGPLAPRLTSHWKFADDILI